MARQIQRYIIRVIEAWLKIFFGKKIKYGTFRETTAGVPTDSTWGFVNFGDIGEHSGEWHPFMVADLSGQAAASDGDNIYDTNSLMFVANEKVTLFIGRTSGDNVLAGSRTARFAPGKVRIRCGQ